jgi:hypothetical protein
VLQTMLRTLSAVIETFIIGVALRYGFFFVLGLICSTIDPSIAVLADDLDDRMIVLMLSTCYGVEVIFRVRVVLINTVLFFEHIGSVGLLFTSWRTSSRPWGSLPCPPWCSPWGQGLSECWAGHLPGRWLRRRKAC